MAEVRADCHVTEITGNFDCGFTTIYQPNFFPLVLCSCLLLPMVLFYQLERGKSEGGKVRRIYLVLTVWVTVTKL